MGFRIVKDSLEVYIGIDLKYSIDISPKKKNVRIFYTHIDNSPKPILIRFEMISTYFLSSIEIFYRLPEAKIRSDVQWACLPRNLNTSELIYHPAVVG